LTVKRYAALFKGKYNAYRTLGVLVNLLLIVSFLLTAFCGMAMSTYAVPFLYGMAKLTFVRRTHLSLSHWSFVLMGLHLGLHVPVILAKYRLNEKQKTVLRAVSCLPAAAGLFLFLHNHMPDYLFFRVPFAFLDYEKAALLVFAENVLMLVFWVFVGSQAAVITRKTAGANEKNRRMPLIFTAVSVIAGLALNLIIPSDISPASMSDWDQPAASEEPQTQPPKETLDAHKEHSEPIDVNDGFILIQGGSFMMGSPESENWRIDDEQIHEVTVSSFYADPYETTQAEYERLMSENPCMFKGENLPAETVSWFDAIRYANARSEEAGFTPVYTVSGDSVVWDRSADGYRLPTEAEWEYMCRAGTSTPFNTEKSLDASEANFYGHYPYEIEENYFDNSVLEARPGEYRQTTVDVGSFEPNAWGLYDCHGNVNEWCWDYYGDYDLTETENPAGPDSGSRHVYRGGGWNDFAKNMRSAYRAAAQADFAGFNLGVRLVRNASDDVSGTLTAKESVPSVSAEGNVLIAYFSWGGNTRGIAGEIQKQTGYDLFEITLVHPYSIDYNTVLMEAQEDQHNQARPELAEHVENMDQYDTVLIGYPNWWASIPMPVASFLEEYDFSGKQIIPFCSHGGGRFGQSMTAIAKLAPDAKIGTGLSIHYSGGTSLSDDVAEWLEVNGLK